MAIAAAATPHPGASCAVGRNVIYAGGSSLICWNVDANKVEVVMGLADRITAIVCGTAENVVVGTDSGKVYHISRSKVIDEVAVPKSVTCMAFEGGRLAIGCMDGTVRTFQTDGSKLEPITTLPLKGYALCLAYIDTLLVVGGTACKLMVIDLATAASVTLEGHENWVQSLSVRNIDGGYVLASASQERYVRLWKFLSHIPNQKVDPFSSSETIGKYSVSFEALLMGHDDWVVSVNWDTNGSLLSASSDSSLIVWEAEDGDLWTPNTRLGDVSQWGASTATGTSGGFWAGIWMEARVLTTTITGSWRQWMRPLASGGEWTAVPGPTGHFKDVTDVTWLAPDLLLSTSLDQTTRLWYVNENNDLWEIGRPQIHGYDMIAVAPVNNQQFVSAGDEKVVRVFDLPKQVARQIEKLRGHSGSGAFSDLPDTAAVPVLGLSNKPQEENTEELPVNPREDHLQKLTLWPEVDKLYGHGYEVCALAVSPQLNRVISCCKANKAQHAKLRFYSSESWHEVGEPVGGHTLTVTKLRVSPDGKRVLSVSRDRSFMVTDIETQQPVIEVPKAHTRIVWDGCFINSKEFLTVSRDSKLKRWKENETVVTYDLKVPGLAVDYEDNKIVVGDEAGTVRVFEMTDTSFDLVQEVHVEGRISRVSIKNGRVAVASSMVTIFDTQL